MQKFDFQKYNNDYKKNHYKRYALMVPVDDVEIINELEAKKSKNAFILDCVRKCIQEEKKGLKKI